MFRTAVNAGHTLKPLTARKNAETKFGRNLYLIANAFDCFSDQHFILKWAINFCGIKEGDAQINRSVNGVNCLRLFGSAIGKTHSHTTQT